MTQLFYFILIFNLNLISYEIGVSGNYLINNYSENAQEFEGAILCGDFEEYQSNVINLGINYKFNIIDNFYLGINSDFIQNSTEFFRNDIFESRNDISLDIENVNTKTTLKYDIGYLGAGLAISYKINEFLTGPFMIDLNFNYLIPFNTKFIQNEVIQSPDNAVFINDNFSQNRLISEGEITTANALLYPRISLINFIKLNDNFSFSQNFSYAITLNNNFEDAANKFYNYSIGIGLTYNFTKEIENDIEKIMIEEEIKKDVIDSTIMRPKPIEIKNPYVTLEVISNWEDNSVLLTGQELLSSLPLVNSIFYELNSAEIPANYQINELKNQNYFYGDALEAHNNVIPRIVSILKNKGNSKLKINSYIASEIEKNTSDLSKNRAENVKTILTNLGIEEDRIILNIGEDPKNKSNTKYKEGIEENCRVDLELIDAPIQEYVSFQKFNELNGDIICRVDYGDLVSTPILYNSLNDSSILVREKGEYVFNIKKRLDSNTKDLYYKINFGAEETNKSFESKILFESMNKKEIEYDFSNFEAIIRFDYNSDQLSNENKNLLRQLIEKLPRNSKISILGSSDSLGSKELNLKLEEDRAKNTEIFINSINGKNLKIQTGRINKKFPEATPQGRFLNRSIRIRIEN